MFAFWFLLDVLAVVTTFGVGIALNMIFRRWWVSVALGAILSVYLFARVGFGLTGPEWILYVIACLGVAFSALGVKALKKSGYALFSK